jgi:hypothetical protein
MRARFTSNPNLRIFLAKDPDHIWAIDGGNRKINLAFDSGDAGFVPLTVDQAKEVIEVLQDAIEQLEGG